MKKAKTKAQKKQKADCIRKIKYSEIAAHRTAKEINKKGKGYVHAYRCPYCREWHVGRVWRNVALKMAFERARRQANA